MSSILTLTKHFLAFNGIKSTSTISNGSVKLENYNPDEKGRNPIGDLYRLIYKKMIYLHRQKELSLEKFQSNSISIRDVPDGVLLLGVIHNLISKRSNINAPIPRGLMYAKVWVGSVKKFLLRKTLRRLRPLLPSVECSPANSSMIR